MKKMKRTLAFISFLLLCSIFMNLVSCRMPIQAEDLMKNVSPNDVSGLNDLDAGNTAVTDFAVRLFKEMSDQGRNTLISPLSILSALAMTANGAAGQTLEQMESVLGMSVDELNLYLYTYVNSLPQGKNYKLSLANSIWFTEDERLIVNRSFLQKNADYYGAEIYKAPFNDQTLRDINNWVDYETDGMIPKVIDDVSEDTIMYLVNALAFDADWMDQYVKSQVSDAVFTKEDGTKQSVKMMYSREGQYLEDEKATGFIKYYKGGKYAFAALLPKEGVSLDEYISSLNGEGLSEILNNSVNAEVNTAIPKFETEFDAELSDVLSSIGMVNAFDENLSDFSNLGGYAGGKINISAVIHKTYIQVGEKGTRAGAVTVVEMDAGASPNPEEPKEVYLDRPFVYMLIDCENNIPFFIGSMTDINE